MITILKSWTAEELDRAYRFSRHNRLALQEDKRCGCFHCRRIFSPAEIREWEAEPISFTDTPETALCPFCQTGAVLGEGSGFPIEPAFLAAMNERHCATENLLLRAIFGDPPEQKEQPENPKPPFPTVVPDPKE